MKRFYFLLTSVIFFTACEKKTKETVADPEPESTLSRSIHYTNRNTTANASYSGNAITYAQAGIDGANIFLGVSAMPTVNNTGGDGIAFKIDKAYLQQGLKRTFNLDAQTAPAVFSVRYNYMFQKADGGFWSTIHETTMGLKMEGQLTITDYNADRKLLSGSFNLVIKDLINDPAKIDNSHPIDPLNLNTVTVTGTFTNIKLAME